MRDILPDILDALARNQRVAWARVVSTWGSAPRRPGAAMAVESPSRWSGSVSGGCVEHAVIDEALGTLASGESQFVTYGVSSETAWSVGLSCGGRLQVFIEPFPACSRDPVARDIGHSLLDAVQSDRPAVLATPLHGDDTPLLFSADGRLMQPESGTSESQLAEAAKDALRSRTPAIAELAAGRWFMHPFPPRDRLVIVGGSEIARRLIPLAHSVDFETVLIDPRQVVAEGGRFVERPHHIAVDAADAGLARFEPTSSTYAVLLTHEPAIDDPALHILLRSPARYIGALGGRKTQAARRERLLGAGFTEAEIARIDGPVGLPIGAATPSEIAISIVARLVERRRAVLEPCLGPSGVQ